MLYYVPLEPYKERYTMQWSAAKTGWLERRWIEAEIPYTRIDGEMGELVDRPMKTGYVLDGVKRTRWGFSQVERILNLADNGVIKTDDVIYFDDFWHPGIEMLAYNFHLMKIAPRMFAFLHAQSVDEFDFTYPMRTWMRPFEQGIAAMLNGVFVDCTILKDLVVQGSICSGHKVHVVGLPICVEEIRSRIPPLATEQPRKNHVVFSARWDWEKNPDFFLRVARQILKHRDDVKFIVCTGSKMVRSNRPSLLAKLAEATLDFPNNIIVKQGLSKEEYYHELAQAKIQMSTSDQDFVSITLLEASIAGAFPVYPYFRSFPEVLRREQQFFYERLDVGSAVFKLLSVLDRDDLWTPEARRERGWIHDRMDTTWRRMLAFMGVQGATNIWYDDPYAV